MRWMIALALAGLVSTPSAQDAMAALDEYAASFDVGITAIADGRHEDGIAAFERCLELVPDDPASAYNLACCHALLSQVDAAFEWLRRSAGWGLGNSSSERTLLLVDPDLAVLRDDPRFAEITARVEQRRAALATFAEEAARYIPPSLEGAESLPLLVVLHDYGETRDAIVHGPWRAVAEELGMALLAPSGGVGTGSEPSEGMAWFANTAAFTAAPWEAEHPAHEAVRLFRREHVVDRERVLIAGQGQGGTVALHMALFAPGFYRGALSLDGPPVSENVPPLVEAAAREGLRLTLLVDLAGAADDAERQMLEDAARSYDDHLATWGLAGRCTTWRSDADGPLPGITEILAGLLPADG